MCKLGKKKKKSESSTERRSQAQKSGFHETTLPGDRGYVKPTKDGGRLHKYGKSSPIHKDKADPTRNPIKHISKDVIGKRLKKLKFW